MSNEWSNWSGSLKFTPREISHPQNEEEIIGMIHRAREKGEIVRVFGKGHSSVPLVETDGILMSLDKMSGVESHDSRKSEAVVLGGTTIKEGSEQLLERGFMFHNTGDVDYQMLAGAIGTGTHGTGIRLQNISGMLIGVRLMDGHGQVHEYSFENNPDFMNAARLSLGALGIFTKLKIQVIPRFKLHRREWCTHIETLLEHLDELIENNRNFDFYWYPRNDEGKIRIANKEGENEQDLEYAKPVKDETGWLGEILPQERGLKFDEIEYALPLEAGPACFRELRKRMKEKHRKESGWRVLYRTVASDNSWLSPFYKRDSVTIACLHNAGLPYEEYFRDVEQIFKSYGGRPHWGKKHFQSAGDLQPLYPKWDQFLELRKRMDPDDVFLNDYLKKILGV